MKSKSHGTMKLPSHKAPSNVPEVPVVRTAAPSARSCEALTRKVLKSSWIDVKCSL